MATTGQELADVDDPAWPKVLGDVAGATVSVDVLPVDAARGLEVLERLQVTARSTMGAIALNCGGLVLDHGWVRILGAGNHVLPDIATANGLGPDADTAPGHLVIAHDVLGGLFAIDGGGLGIGPGEVCYWGPDTLEWTGIGGGYSTFLTWALGGGLADFYAQLRWPDWQHDSQALALDQGLSIYPPLFTEEGRRDIAAASRRAVPLTELREWLDDVAGQLAP